MKPKWYDWVTILICLVLFVALPGFGSERIKPVTGSYKQVLRKAGEQGKPVMIDFYTDWCGWCKKMDSVIEQVPDTMAKFAYYRVNAEQEKALAQQFQVRGYPTFVFVKPDGTEFHRWSGAYRNADDLKHALEGVLQKAGKIEPQPAETAAKPAASAGVDKSSIETAAANELKTAQLYIDVGRKTDAARALKQVIAKYPGTDAAAQAKEKLGAIGDAK